MNQSTDPPLSQEQSAPDEQAVEVHIVFKHAAQPLTIRYHLIQSELDKLIQHWRGNALFGVYDATQYRGSMLKLRTVKLMLRFEDVLYIG